jgi:GT2 family glycosyltransferase
LKKRIFVVIVTYNGAKWIEKCIYSLLDSHYPVEIIVVDNCSTDETISLLKTFETIHFIPSVENLGFGKANNIAIDYALKNKADYVFLLNQDTWIFNDTIEKLVAVAEADASFGIVSPMHFSGYETILDESFKVYLSRQTKRFTTIDAVSVPFVNAAAWLVSKDCLEKVGLFEPLYTHYGEDRNYCDRVLYHRFSIVVAEGAKICHDRIVTRNFNKDCTQSKFSILSQVLNVNYSVGTAYLLALRSVFGLPKYFRKSYGFMEVTNLFYKLLRYYISLVFSLTTLIKKRESYK